MARNFVAEMDALQAQLVRHRRDGTDWTVTESAIDALERDMEAEMRRQVVAAGLTPSEEN